MNDTELAWAAGFFDGEGSAFVNHQRKVPHKDRANPASYDITTPVLSVCQVDVRPLLRFSKAVNGRKPTGPYKHKKEGHNKYYRWDACGRPSVHRIVTLLWPYLSEPKKEQIRKVWEELMRLKGKKSPELQPLPVDKDMPTTSKPWVGVDL